MPSNHDLSRISSLLSFGPRTIARDWYAIRQEMVDAIDTLNPEWTARSLSDPGIALLELAAYGLDGIHFTLDVLHRDSRWRDSFSRDAILSFAELLNYNVQSANSASVELTYTVDRAQDDSVVIPSLTQVQTSSGQTFTFENNAELTIAGPDFVDTTTLTGTTITAIVADSAIYDIGDKIEFNSDLVLRTITAKPNGTTIQFAGHPLASNSPTSSKIRNYGLTATSIPLSVTGTATEGVTQTDSNFATGDNTKLQEYVIRMKPIMLSTLKIYINEGGGNVLWTKATNNRVINHTSNENVYEVSVLGNDDVLVRFGDGVNGRKVPLGATITAQARVTKGKAGNVKANTITALAGSLTFTGRMSITNTFDASGGSDRESLQSIKRNAPNNLSVFIGNIVGKQDYKTVAEAVAGVEKVSPFLIGFNTVHIYVVPTGSSGSIPSQLILSSVEAVLNDDNKRMLGVRSVALAPKYVYVDMEAKIFLESNVSNSALTSEISSKLVAFFSPSTREFGETGNEDTYIRLGDLYQLIENISGVKYCEITAFHRRPELKQTTWSGDATISEIDISETTVDEEWQIVFTSYTTFKVTGSVSGITYQGSLDDLFTSGNGEISFVLSSGNTVMREGDTGTIMVSKRLSNTIKMFDREFPVQGRSIGTNDVNTISIIGGLQL